MRLRSHRPPLPPELIAYIIDYIDCPVALKNCSRVCHAWLPLSRPHIFHVVSVVLKGRGFFKPLQRLNDVLEKSPCISTYISELCITRTARCLSMVTSEFSKLCTILPALLHKLTNLRKISMSRIEWTKMTTPEIRSAARALVDRPSLVHMRVVSSWFDKLDHLTALLPPTLKRLDISQSWGVGVGDVIDEENKRLPPQKPCQLEYLECDITSPLADWLLNSQQLDISNVHTLDVFSIYDQSECISRMVRRLGSSLQHLRIAYSCAEIGPSFWIDVSHNPNIKSISFSGQLLSEALPSFKNLISSLVATNIEQISFACLGWDFSSRSNSIWEELDGILQSDQFTTLREFELRVLGVVEDERPLWQKLSSRLPSLHARGILHFHRFATYDANIPV